MLTYETVNLSLQGFCHLINMYMFLIDSLNIYERIVLNMYYLFPSGQSYVGFSQISIYFASLTTYIFWASKAAEGAVVYATAVCVQAYCSVRQYHRLYFLSIKKKTFLHFFQQQCIVLISFFFCFVLLLSCWAGLALVQWIFFLKI